MNSPSHRSGRGAASVAAFCILVAMAVFAPLIRGGNRPLPLLVLEVMAVAGLFIALVPTDMRRRIPPAAAIVAGLAAAIPLLGLLPLPPGLWSSLPGREQFAATLAAGGDAGAWRALSLAPFETEYAGLALLPPLAAFFLVLGLRPDRLRTLCIVIVAVAVMEAVLGLLQYGAGGGQVANFRASGTYVNPNHFAGLMLLALPLALMFLALEVGQRQRGRRFAVSFADVLRQFAASKGTRVIVWLAAIVLCLLGLMFSRSRAGISIGAIGIALTALIAAPRVGGSRAYGAVGVGLTLALGFGIAIGLVPVLDRFAQPEGIDDGRIAIVTGALNMAGHYFPFGAGLGTFASLYPPYQPDAISALVHRAHNDYVEWLTEGGVLAALAIVAALALYITRVVMLVRIKDKDATHCLQLAAAISVLLLAMHGMVDFNFRIPANALLFAMLAGVLVARHDALATRPVMQRRPSTPDSKPPERMPAVPVPVAATAREEADRVVAAWTVPLPTAASPSNTNVMPQP
ncbi:MAG TPA: O-antigen ligase family protein, partial [Rhizomicrobium sp.]